MDVVAQGEAPSCREVSPSRGLLPAEAFESLSYQAAEDAAIWSRVWVGVGFAAEIPAAGDVLPFTVGHHGIHLERMTDGAIAGRFNKAQHGGCRVVPLQCRTGAKTKCSFTACGHSRDRKPIASADVDRDRQLDQYFGLRPERLLPVAVKQWGELLLVRLEPGSGAALDWPGWGDTIPGSPSHETIWREVAGNWKLHASRLAASDASVAVLFPNVVIQHTDDFTIVMILQPTALDRTLCRVRVLTRGVQADVMTVDAAVVALLRQADGENTNARCAVFEAAVASAIGEIDGEPSRDYRFRTDERRGW